MKNRKALGFVAFAIFCGFIGAGMGYAYSVAKYGKGTEQGDEQQKAAVTQEHEYKYKPTSVVEEKITPSTKMVYQYYYTEDGVTEVQEDVPPYFMLDLTLSDVSKYYTAWDIVSFSPKEVVLRKTIEGESQQRYVVGQKDGYVAVYYEEEQDGVSLKEITGISVDGLSEDEKIRLNQGIKIVGDEALARTLENYSS
ncbi:MAG: BofC C-terminal domain-containing protein [Lachnospiraceae bacterium]|nr:BofC C-terminal domain-containing protein [Lachnospiraceae bacterium]